MCTKHAYNIRLSGGKSIRIEIKLSRQILLFSTEIEFAVLKKNKHIFPCTKTRYRALVSHTYLRIKFSEEKLAVPIRFVSATRYRYAYEFT